LKTFFAGKIKILTVAVYLACTAPLFGPSDIHAGTCYTSTKIPMSCYTSYWDTSGIGSYYAGKIKRLYTDSSPNGIARCPDRGGYEYWCNNFAEGAYTTDWPSLVEAFWNAYYRDRVSTTIPDHAGICGWGKYYTGTSSNKCRYDCDAIAYSQSSVNFGNVEVGSSSSRTVTLTNVSDESVEMRIPWGFVMSAQSITPYQIKISSTTCYDGQWLSPGASCRVTGTFRPHSPGYVYSRSLFATSTSTGYYTPVLTWSGTGIQTFDACDLPWGGSIPHGSSVRAYSATVSSSCSSITRTCNDGTLSGSSAYKYATCRAPYSCSLPWGGSISHGSSTTAYASSTDPQSCTSQTRTCNDGTLSGSYRYNTCRVLEQCTKPWGGSMLSGDNIYAYAASIAQTCSGQTRTCYDGSLSGSYTKSSCVQDRAGPSVTVKYNNSTFSSGSYVDAITGFRISLSDDYDSSPSLVSAKMGTTTLTYNRSGNNYYITGPSSLDSIEYNRTLTVKAKDKYDNYTTKTYTVKRDTTAPVIGNYKYNGSPYSGNSRIYDIRKLSFTVTDNLDSSPSVSAYLKGASGSGISTSVRLDLSRSGSTYTISGPTSINTAQFAGGYLDITATDDGSNSERDTGLRGISLDNIKPTITVRNNGSSYSGGHVRDIRNLSFTVIDGRDANPVVTAKFNSMNLSLSRSGDVWNVTGPTSLNSDEIIGTLSVTAKDNYNNSNTVTHSTTIDDTAPVISDIRYDGQPYAGNARILDVSQLSFKVVDGLDTSPTIKASVNGSNLSFSRSGNVYTVSGPSSLNSEEFEKDLTISAEDNYGNKSSHTTPNVIMDNIAPTILVENGGISFTGGRIIDISKVDVFLSDGHTEEPQLDVLKIESPHDYYTDQIEYHEDLEYSRTDNLLAVTGPLSINTEELDYDTTMTITARDQYDNVRTEVLDIVVDNIPPVIERVNYDLKQFDGGQIYDISLLTFNVFDGVAAEPTSTATLYGHTLDVDTTGYTNWVTGPLSLNAEQFESTLEITATDDFGQSTTYTVDVALDNGAASTTLLYDGQPPVAGEWVEDFTRFTLEATDELDPEPELFEAFVLDNSTGEEHEIEYSTEHRTSPVPHSFFTVDGPEELKEVEMYPATLHFGVTDMYNAQQTVEHKFILDNKAPRVEFIYAGSQYQSPEPIMDIGEMELALTDQAATKEVVAVQLEEDFTGNTYDIASNKIQDDGGRYELVHPSGLDMDHFGSGKLKVTVKDEWGNQTTHVAEAKHDNDAPQIEVTMNGKPFTGGPAESLEDIVIKLQDEFDPDPSLVIEAEDMNSGDTAVLEWNDDGSIKPKAQSVWLNPGEITLRFTATDRYGNQASEEREVDNLAPRVLFYNGSSDEFSGGELNGFSTFSFRIEDSFDSDPENIDTTLDGDSHPKASVETDEVSTNAYIIVPPPLEASLHGVPYTVAVTTQDKYGNTATHDVGFDYVSYAVETFNREELLIPNIEKEFTRQNGDPALVSQPLITQDGEDVTGVHDIKALLLSSSQVPLVVNGNTIHPGEVVTVASDYDFGASGGEMKLSITSAAAGLTGKSTLILQPQMRRAPAVQAEVKVWGLDEEAVPNKEEVQQFFELAQVSITNKDTACMLTTDKHYAQTHDVFEQPRCYVTWEPAAGLEPHRSDDLTLEGFLFSKGENVTHYKVEIFDTDGSSTELASGHVAINVTDPPEIEFYPTQRIDQMYKQVTQADFTLKQKEGPSMALYVDEGSVRPHYGSSLKTAGLEWTNLPTGLAQEEGSIYPSIQGNIPELGDYKLSWAIYILDPDGNKHYIAEQEKNIEVTMPPPPEIELETSLEVLDDNSLAAPVTPTVVGTFSVRAPAGAGHIALSVTDPEGNLDTSSESTGMELNADGSMATFTKTITVDEGQVWNREILELSAHYVGMPENKSTAEVELLRVPPERTALILDTPREALDVEGLPYTVKVGDVARDGDVVYDPERHGEWDAQIEWNEGGNFIPLAQNLDLGTGESAGTIEDVEPGSMILQAKAKVASPDGLYEKEITSSRQYLVVYTGHAPDANIVARYFAGRAPLRISLALNMSAADRVAVDHVRWEYSKDQGGTWETLKEYTGPTRLLMSLEEGVYQFRALVVNGKTDEKAFTETVQIQAYNLPDIEVSGSRTVFVGSEVKAYAETFFEGEPVPAEVRWESRGGDLLQTGDTFTDVPEEPTTYYLNAKAKLLDAPAEEERAWAGQYHIVQAKPVRPPRGAIIGPYYIEEGKTYNYEARTQLPYARMESDEYRIKGEWVLPDGTTVEGPELEYTATEADADAGTIYMTYRTWIEGYRDKGAEVEIKRRVNATRYVWPEFEIRKSQTYAQAPTTVSLHLMPVDYRGGLEDPQYTWDLPESANVTREYSYAIVAEFLEPGIFDVTGYVVDARGNEREVTTQIVVEEAQPFEVTPVINESNEFMRAPLSLYVRANTTGGHPRDRMLTYYFYLNGEKLDASYSAHIHDLDVGTYVLKAEGHSRYGIVASGEEEIVVVPNKPPECDVEMTYSDHRYRPQYLFRPSCTDPDGRVVSYRWMMDGIRLSSAARVNITAPEEDEPANWVELTVTDDSGGEYTESFEMEPRSLQEDEEGESTTTEP